MVFFYQNLLKSYEISVIPSLKYAHKWRGKEAKQ